MLIQMILIHGIDELPFELSIGILHEFSFGLSTGIELGSNVHVWTLRSVDEGHLMASIQST